MLSAELGDPHFRALMSTPIPGRARHTPPNPHLVMPSAGVGRTGTFIALDVLLRQLEGEGLVGPFDFVRKMRRSRPLMVQTEVRVALRAAGQGWRWAVGDGRWAMGNGLQAPGAALIPAPACSQAQYVFLHQCVLRHVELSAKALTQEVEYENVANVIYENVNAIGAYELQV